MKKIILILFICQNLFSQSYQEFNDFYSLVRSDTFYVFEPATIYINEMMNFYTEFHSKQFSPIKPKLTYYSLENFEISDTIDTISVWEPIMKINPLDLYDEREIYYNKYTVLIKCYEWNSFSKWNHSTKKWTDFYDKNFLLRN